MNARLFHVLLQAFVVTLIVGISAVNIYALKDVYSVSENPWLFYSTMGLAIMALCGFILSNKMGASINSFMLSERKDPVFDNNTKSEDSMALSTPETSAKTSPADMNELEDQIRTYSSAVVNNVSNFGMLNKIVYAMNDNAEETCMYFEESRKVLQSLSTLMNEKNLQHRESLEKLEHMNEELTVALQAKQDIQKLVTQLTDVCEDNHELNSTIAVSGENIRELTDTYYKTPDIDPKIVFNRIRNQAKIILKNQKQIRKNDKQMGQTAKMLRVKSNQLNTMLTRLMSQTKQILNMADHLSEADLQINQIAQDVSYRNHETSKALMLFMKHTEDLVGKTHMINTACEKLADTSLQLQSQAEYMFHQQLPEDKVKLPAA